MKLIETRAIEKLATLIFLAPFSRKRIAYISAKSRAIYESKDRIEEKIFDFLGWQVAICSHAPSNSEYLIGWQAYYKNVSRGKQKIKIRMYAYPAS